MLRNKKRKAEEKKRRGPDVAPFVTGNLESSLETGSACFVCQHGARFSFALIICPLCRLARNETCSPRIIIISGLVVFARSISQYRSYKNDKGENELYRSRSLLINRSDCFREATCDFDIIKISTKYRARFSKCLLSERLARTVYRFYFLRLEKNNINYYYKLCRIVRVRKLLYLYRYTFA